MTGHTITIEHQPPSEPGALSGWRVTCTCGHTFGTSLSQAWAERLGRQHLLWHADHDESWTVTR